MISIIIIILTLLLIKYNCYIINQSNYQLKQISYSQLFDKPIRNEESQQFIYDDYESNTFDEVSDSLKYFREYTKRGISRLRNNNLQDALNDFNKAKQYNNTQPLIQRGILLYCLEQYEEAEKQFDSDILKIEKLKSIKASDLRLWRSACLNKLGYHIEAKRAIDMYLFNNDIYEPRYLINCTLDFYASRKDLIDILDVIDSYNQNDKRDFLGIKFYGNFYLGLYYDSMNDYEAAKSFLSYPNTSDRYPKLDMWYHIPRILYNLRFGSNLDS